MRSLDTRILITILIVLISCCTNVLFLELITRESNSAAIIITLTQFLFISIEGFIFTSKCGSVTPTVPLKHYVILVIHYFVANVSNNFALDFNISMPLHMIFKSGSLIANMILGIIILKRRYTKKKYLSVIIITIGIIICTFASANHLNVNDGQQVDTSDSSSSKIFFNWSIGIFLLVVSLFSQANMGIYQEKLSNKFGKHPREALFYTHVLPMPAFILFSHNIYSVIVSFNSSLPITIPLLSISVPKLWLYLLVNVITQYVCVLSVFTLTCECASLTVTLVVTLRKFLSLILSIYYFANPFTMNHWFGTVLVFSGSLLFVDVIPLRYLFYEQIQFACEVVLNNSLGIITVHAK